MLSDDDYTRHSTYFGVYSASQAARVSELLESLGVRFEFVREEQDEERLKAWTAWDPAASNPTDTTEAVTTADVPLPTTDGDLPVVDDGTTDSGADTNIFPDENNVF